MQDLISVIIPAYNAEAVIERCVESVRSQTYKNIEVVVVDDGSQDDTGRIADRLAKEDARLNVIHQLNSGLSGARNAGIEHATGDFIYFIDADDYIDADELLLLWEETQKTGASIVIGGINKVSENGAVLSCIALERAVVDELGFWSRYAGDYESEEHSEYVVSCGKLFERSLFDNERFDLGRIHEDEFIIHRLISRSHKIVFAETAGYNYVQCGGSIMHTPSAKARLDAADALLERAAYFVSRNWWDLAFMEVCEVRGALSSSIEADASTANTDRFRNVAARWAKFSRQVGSHVPGELKKKALCTLFRLAPSLYIALKRIG